MATILEKYRQKQEDFRTRIEQGNFPPRELLVVQELSYRISVLETFQSFCKSAPVTTDVNVMGQHYKMVEAGVRCALAERRVGAKPDAEGQKKRETAFESFQRVVTDSSRRFTGYNAGTPEQYQTDIARYINTILPVWIQYRNTYVNV